MIYAFAVGFSAAVIGAMFGNDPLSIAGIAAIPFVITAAV